MKKLAFVITLIFFSHFVHAQKVDSLDIKIGQLIMIGIPKAEVDSTILTEVKRGRVGAIIYFEKNIPKLPSAFAAFKKISWTYQKAAPIPLLICIDQEGGKVNRLKEKYGFTRSITAESIGKFQSLDSVRFYAEATAATLAGLGINVNFAPDVDVAVNPNNPVIVKNGRSYSSNEDSVTFFAKEVIKQHRRYGIVTALKHFPGHGSSENDTHLGLADVTNTWSMREVKPYKNLIDSNYVDAVMSSHIVNKHLDKDSLPGTLSKAVIGKFLRTDLHYNGVVFSDDMQMGAIVKNYGFEEAIKLAINAGIDILCFGNNVKAADIRTVDDIHSIIKKFVLKGEISKARIDESYRRIIQLKKTIGQTEFDKSKVLSKQLAQQSLELKKAKEEIEKLSTKTTKKSKKKKKK